MLSYILVLLLFENSEQSSYHSLYYPLYLSCICMPFHSLPRMCIYNLYTSYIELVVYHVLHILKEYISLPLFLLRLVSCLSVIEGIRIYILYYPLVRLSLLLLLILVLEYLRTIYVIQDGLMLFIVIIFSSYYLVPFNYISIYVKIKIESSWCRLDIPC